MRRVKIRCLLLPLVLIAILWLGSCGKEEQSAPAAQDQQENEVPKAERAEEGLGESEKKEITDPYQAPEFADSSFHSDQAEGDGNVRIDLSAADQGYVGVEAVSDKRLKFQVMKDDATYNYDVDSDGTSSIFPLQCGSGSYQFRVMENVVDTKYAELYSTSCDVSLMDEFQPFIRPSDYVAYDKDSDCVKQAEKLASEAEDVLGVVHGVFDYICDHVTYDKAKAKSVKAGYMPDPDETMATGKGICFDYASLAAAMLRSQGIPTKVIFGYVAPNDLYHAWNMFYTGETGWVTVKYEVKGDDWNRLDLTFAANGADGDFIGDGSNYTDVYCY